MGLDFSSGYRVDGGGMRKKEEEKKYNKGKAKEIDYISKSEKGHPELYTYTAPGGSTISLLPSSLVFLNIFFPFFLFRHIKFSLFHLFFFFRFLPFDGGGFPFSFIFINNFFFGFSFLIGRAHQLADKRPNARQPKNQAEPKKEKKGKSCSKSKICWMCTERTAYSLFPSAFGLRHQQQRADGQHGRMAAPVGSY
jgi:hypothetical protein